MTARLDIAPPFTEMVSLLTWVCLASSYLIEILLPRLHGTININSINGPK
jgi:hypothetical protein